LKQFWSSAAFALATAIGVAAALAFATVLALLAAATALAFATVFTSAIMFARVASGRVRAGRRVRAVLREGFHGEARHQSRDGGCDEQCFLGSVHNVFWFGLFRHPCSKLFARRNQISFATDSEWLDTPSHDLFKLNYEFNNSRFAVQGNPR
jgi:hypothetical protein